MQKTYRVVETRTKTDKDGEAHTFPVSVWVDNLDGERVELEHGTTFTAELDTVKIIDPRTRFSANPVEVDTGRFYVKSSDADVKPGCLTSLIATGRAVDADAEPKAKKTKSKKK